MNANSMPLLAHVSKDEAGTWRVHTLEQHLEGVSNRAKSFSIALQSESWASPAAWLHDFGKSGSDFQHYLVSATGYDQDAHLEGQAGRVDHSTAGAIWASTHWGKNGILLSYLIAGHHAGLPDWHGAGAGLEARLAKWERLHMAETSGTPFDPLSLVPPEQPPLVHADHPEDAHLWLRMLFSCLVDADFLDTEAFMDEEKAGAREATKHTLMDLKMRLDAHMARLTERAEETQVNAIRAQVLAACRSGAAREPGLFSLTVPTGGGKTLASLAFALDHALRHGKHRIVIVIPYTSIIEQTAEVLERIFGPGAVLEHHSNLDPERETRQSRLASENWDAPIIVTTNVQFFESLFAAKTSACRKLHNLVGSVVVFDEAQMLPPAFLKPILQVLDSLVRHYQVSAVLCTATQPALQGRVGSQGTAFEGLKGVQELMLDPMSLTAALSRTTLRLHSPDLAPVQWEDLAEELSVYDRLLCIVNTRKDCRTLHALMPEGTLHLSALMCPQHRSEVIQVIKDRLKDGRPVRVISTQLVEAGVDLDFPVVYRALAGLDSIAQAAGRCNREGKLGRLGEVVLFVPPKPSRSGLLRKGEDTLLELLRSSREAPLNLDPAAFDHYFKLFYSKVNSFDEKHICDLLVKDAARGKFQFREAAQAFRLIEDEDQQAIIVRYGPHRERLDRLVDELRYAGPNRDRIRALQRFSVNLHARVAQELVRQGEVEEVQGLLVQAVDGLYDGRTGLCPDFVRFNPDLFTL